MYGCCRKHLTTFKILMYADEAFLSGGSQMTERELLVNTARQRKEGLPHHTHGPLRRGALREK